MKPTPRTALPQSLRLIRAGFCLSILIPGCFTPLHAQVYEKVYGFSSEPGIAGREPKAGLLQGSDGNLYGTTSVGGSANLGTVFMMIPSGGVTTLAEFTGTTAAAATPRTFSNSTRIALDSGYSGAPYPSRIVVPPGIDVVSKLRVILHEFSHGAPDHVRLLLVGPDGKKCLLMSAAGGSNSLSGVTFTLDDSAATEIPVDFGNGTYQPTPGTDSSVNLNSPAPAAPYATQLSIFNGQPSTGTWSLYAMDTGGSSGSGRLAGGWSLEITPTGIRGSSPSAIVEGNDGNLYGTTSGGGSSGSGTIFRISPFGVPTTLADFPPTATNGTISSLIQASDGKFYGTTSTRGTSGLGTVFRFVPEQPLETLMNFTGNSTSNKGSAPLGSLIEGSDGKLYGTTSTGGTSGLGTVYRFVPGQPLETLVTFTGNGASDKGSAPKAPLLQTIDGKFYSTTSAGGTSGFGTIFRFVPGQPLETLVNFTGNGASNKGSAPLAGLTEAGGGKFYGTSSTGGTADLGTVFRLTPLQPLETMANFTAPDGTPQAPLTFAADGLPYGTASGPQGTIYRLIVPGLPVLSAREPKFVDELSILLQTSIASSGALTSLTLEYGLDGVNFPNLVPIPGSISNISSQILGTTLSGLQENTLYHYRFRAINSVGTTLSDVRSFKTRTAYTRTDALAGSLNGAFPGAPPQALASVLVTATPAGVGGWRFEGEHAWRTMGAALGGLATSERRIQFRPVPSYLQPPSETINVISGTTISIARFYYPTTTLGNAELTVTLKPASIALGSVPSANRARWRILGENDTQWQNSNATYSGLAPGDYLIEFKPVTAFVTPPPSPVSILGSGIGTRTITYFPADTTTGTTPSPISFATVTTDQTKPYAYVGQIRSSVGFGSGFVVKPRVVATAAHVIFDEGTLSGLTDLQWLFQRDNGTYEPKPIIPRGSYIRSGYEAARRSEDTPGSFTSASQNLDIGAIYFVSELAARGGYTAILESNSSSNEFLESGDNKIIVGYPVNGIAPANQGRLHSTIPAYVSFTKKSDRIYTTSGIRSANGSEGGPLCVERDGFYYPAAIHLGGSTNTIVRAIDQDVSFLIGWADIAAQGFGNPPSGGPTPTGTDGTIVSGAKGGLKVTIEPAAARGAGAAWQFITEINFRSSGSQAGGLVPGSYDVSFKTVPGFTAPATQKITIVENKLTAVIINYQRSLTPLETWRQANFLTTSNTGDAADSADFDGDGSININEYAAGTDPKSSSDVFKVLTTQKTGTSITLTTAGKKSRTYGLQRSPDLTSGAWTTLTTTAPLPADGPVSLTDPAAPPEKAFYRIQVSLP